MEIYSFDIVEKNPVPKSQTKPFYIGTKEAPSADGDEGNEHFVLVICLFETCPGRIFLGCLIIIRKTCPCNIYPHKPHFYIVKLGYAGVYLFLLQNIDCGYSLEPPRRGGPNVYPQSMF